MSYFLTDEQEHELNLFLDEENRNICEQQLNSDDVPEELKEIIRSTIEADTPIPAFNPMHGYYSISFTPCQDGNRIYAHHHLTNKSKSLYDPAKEQEKINSLIENTEPSEVESDEVNNNIIENEIITDDFQVIIENTNPEDLTVEQIESYVGPPPEDA